VTVLVFDIETVPDLDSGRALLGLGSVSDRDVADAMYTLRRQETQGATEFLRPHLHRVVAISVLLAGRGDVRVWSLGEPDSDEAEIVRRFFEGIEKYTPQLVSWNGRGFDLPVLHYRALVHGISAPRYWETGSEDQAFRWNNYLSRYHERHTDLMDVLSGYESRAAAPLHDIAVMLGLPGKTGLSGKDVWREFQAGHVEEIRNYCETDVINTYLVYLRFQLLRGRLTREGLAAEENRLAAALEAEGRPHLLEFLEQWRNASGQKRP
jgi:predicted PolB exonuclease-like 3'-5' exonuclease